MRGHQNRCSSRSGFETGTLDEFPLGPRRMGWHHDPARFTVLVGLSEFERDLIRSRTSEDRTSAKARGVCQSPLGRPRIPTLFCVAVMSII